MVFGILDKMEYGDGKLATASPPFPGIGGQIIGSLLAMPIQMVFGTRVTIAGKIVSGSPGAYSVEEILAGVGASGAALPSVPGAIVGVVENAFDTSGRLRPGGIVARANSAGFYSIIYPYNAFGDPAVGIIAQHFRFPGARGIASSAIPAFEQGVTPVLTLSAVIPVEAGSTNDSSPPVVTLRPPSAVLPVGEAVQVDFLLRDNGSEPSFTETMIDLQASQPLVDSAPLEAADIQFSVAGEQLLAPTLKQVTLSFFATRSMLLAFNTKAVDGNGNQRDSTFRLRFGAPPTSSGPIRSRLTTTTPRRRAWWAAPPARARCSAAAVSWCSSVSR